MRIDFDNTPLSESYQLFIKHCSPHYWTFQERCVTVCKELCQSPQTILEIGTGTGITTHLILQTFPTASITTVDVSQHMLDQAKEYINNPQVTFVHDDIIEFLTNRGEEYDIVVSAQALHNIPSSQRTRLIPLIYQSLKPGGVFVNADKYAHSDPAQHAEALAWKFEQFNALEQAGHKELADAWREHYTADDTAEYRLVEKDWEALLQQTGFTAITQYERWYMESIYGAIKTKHVK